MKNLISINQNWSFVKDCAAPPACIPADAPLVNLPHTWNALDGQDGGSDYWRGACCYMKTIQKPIGERVYVEVEAASSAGKIFINGVEKASHLGGYSLFRADITDELREGENLLIIEVENTARDDIYPQMADFTFYGGLYRGVNLITVNNSHFDLDFHGGNGLDVSAVVEHGAAVVSLDAFIANPTEGQSVEFIIRDAQGTIVCGAVCPAAERAHTVARIEAAHLWDGVNDPYLYSVQALLTQGNEALDDTCANLGVRTYTVDAQKGFFLNGKSMPLRGVSRHQDYLGAGNALTKQQHEADVALIREIGANTVRLAHYQHSQYFYDACDRAGLIVWAEIPFISVMSANPAAHENCISQMKDLIVQNYNHPCICFWGISNEITIGGERDGLLENLRDLDRLVRETDPTRLTTMAHVSMLPMDSEQNQITDVLSYNHYFGWYGGELTDNERWIDAFHAAHPDRPFGISEYGAEGIITYHNDNPKCRDYSEEYQALYHEHLAKVIDERPWLWATHVWNMFDFGCDARAEGGTVGRNNKGLMTIDRKIRKDAFYLYKAYWSNESFVHLCGRRYAQRPGEETTVKVYSNLPTVELYVDGTLLSKQDGNKVFVFEHVPMPVNGDFTMLTAKAGGCCDSITLQKVAEANPTYTFVDPDGDDDSGAAENWFNTESACTVDSVIVNEGYFSVKDKIGEMLANDAAGAALMGFVASTVKIKVKKSMLFMMKDMTIEGIVGMMGGKKSEESEKSNRLLIMLNEVLNKIKK